MKKRRVNWTFVLFMFCAVLYLPTLAVQLSKDTCFFYFCSCAKYIEKDQAYRPFELQWAPTWHTTSAKWRQHVDISWELSHLLSHFFRSWYADAFRSPFGILLVPFRPERYVAPDAPVMACGKNAASGSVEAELVDKWSSCSTWDELKDRSV